jgi:hypothetical protein
MLITRLMFYAHTTLMHAPSFQAHALQALDDFTVSACSATLLLFLYLNAQPLIVLYAPNSYLYSANTNGAPMHPAPIVMADRTGKKIIGAHCMASIAYWRRGTSVRQYIGVPMPPAPLLLADRWFHIFFWQAEQKK